MSKCNTQRQRESHESQTMFNCEEYRKKEIKRGNAYETKLSKF